MFSNTTISQEIDKKYIDSVVINFKGTAQDKFHNQIGNLYSKINSQINAQELFQYLNTKCIDKPTLALSFYNNYASFLYRNGNNKDGLKINTKGLNLAKAYGYKYMLFEYTQLKSYGFINESVPDSALYYANEAEKIALQNKELLGSKLYQVYTHKAMIESLLGNNDERDRFYEKTVQSIEAFPDSNEYSYVLSSAVYHFKTTKNYEKHAYYANKLKAYYFNRDGFSNPKKHMSLSSFLNFENSEEQVEELKKIINLSKDSIINPNQYFQINTLADELIKINKQDEAIYYLENSLKNNNSIAPFDKLLSYTLLEQSYILNDDCDNALDILQKKTVLHDSIRRHEMISKVADFKVKYDTEKKDAELKILKLEKEKERQQKNLFTIIAILGIGVIGLVTYFLYKNNIKNKKLNSQNTLLERTIDDKNVLLREVHHRVKNSFQIVSSLLYLQSENVTDKKAKTAIKEAENRVRSMVLVHQKLYNKDELVGINSKEYISDLVKDIFDSHQFQKEPIKYNLNIEPLVLDIETITPLGLILNELIINTLKHAFEGIEVNNIINVDFAKVDDELILKVADNGKGFEGEIKQTSFGITLMKALSKQLKAKLNYTSKLSEGTQAVLSISKFTILS